MIAAAPATHQLLDTARAFMKAEFAHEATRARACALLVRQALENCLDIFWSRRAPGLTSAPMRVQLLCLREYTSDTAAADTTAQTWYELSAACHARGYGLPPTRGALSAWIANVESLDALLAPRPPTD